MLETMALLAHESSTLFHFFNFFFYISSFRLQTFTAVSLLTGQLCLCLKVRALYQTFVWWMCLPGVISILVRIKQTTKKTLSNWLVVPCFRKQSFASYALIIQCWEKPRRRANNALYSLRSCKDQKHRRTHKVEMQPIFFWDWNTTAQLSSSANHYARWFSM